MSVEEKLMNKDEAKKYSKRFYLNKIEETLKKAVNQFQDHKLDRERYQIAAEAEGFYLEIWDYIVKLQEAENDS